MKSLIYLLTFLAVFMFNSCERFINLQPLDQISTNYYWKTNTDLQNYIVQFYPGAFPNTQMVAETAINSDDFIYGSQSTIMDGERVKSSGNWKSDWSTIRGVNIFFANYQKCTSTFAQYSQYLGEAYFFKAWFYFNLVVKYGDVPWYSKPLDITSDVDLMRPSDPRNLVVDSILVCLDKAVLYLGYVAATGNNRLSKEAALAFKTRVALFEGSWEKYHASDAFKVTGANPNKYFQACVNAADSLRLGSYTHNIYNTGHPNLDYFQLFGFDNMNSIQEIIFCRTFNAAAGAGNTTQDMLTAEPDGKGVTWELVSSYLGIDGHPYNYLGLSTTTKGNDFLTKIANDCDPRLSATIFIPGDTISVLPEALHSTFILPPIDQGAIYLSPTGFQVKKTTNPYTINSGMHCCTPGNTGYILFRYGEVLLNYAEAKYELDNTVAYTQLNLLRSRAGMPNFTVNPQSSDFSPANYGYTISDALYEIRRERRVELALEGLRDMDYMRWAAASLFIGTRPKGYPFKKAEFPNFTPKLDANGLIDYYQMDMPTGYKFRVGTDYLYSIPTDEITINHNLIQNPGW